MSMTKGEALVTGIDKLREGLEMISSLGSKQQDLIKTLVGSNVAANRLNDLLKSNIVFQNTIISMVSARNSKLAPVIVEKVITDFMDVLFDLSQPYQAEEESEG